MALLAEKTIDASLVHSRPAYQAVAACWEAYGRHSTEEPATRQTHHRRLRLSSVSPVNRLQTCGTSCTLQCCAEHWPQPPKSARRSWATLSRRSRRRIIQKLPGSASGGLGIGIDHRGTSHCTFPCWTGSSFSSRLRQIVGVSPATATNACHRSTCSCHATD